MVTDRRRGQNCFLMHARSQHGILYLSVTLQMERDILLGEGEDADSSGEGATGEDSNDKSDRERERSRERAELPRKREHIFKKGTSL